MLRMDLKGAGEFFEDGREAASLDFGTCADGVTESLVSTLG